MRILKKRWDGRWDNWQKRDQSLILTLNTYNRVTKGELWKFDLMLQSFLWRIKSWFRRSIDSSLIDWDLKMMIWWGGWCDLRWLMWWDDVMWDEMICDKSERCDNFEFLSYQN